MKTQNLFKVTFSVNGKSKSIDMAKDVCVVGRAKDCDVEIDADLVSRKHLKITFEKNSLYIEELGSSNGSWLNNFKLPKGVKTLFSEKDILMLGSITGISINIEKRIVQNVQILENVKSVAKAAPAMSSVKKVVNGPPQVEFTEEKTLVDTPKIKLVDAIAPAPTSTPAPAAKVVNLKHGLESKVKQLVDRESEKRREMALKQASLIRQKAIEEESAILQRAKNEEAIILERAQKEEKDILDNAYKIEKEILDRVHKIESEFLQKVHAEEKIILDKARLEEKDILEKAQTEAKVYYIESRQKIEDEKKQAEAGLISLQEQIKKTETHSADLDKKFKHTKSSFEANISGLKKAEQAHLEKIKKIEDEYTLLKEKMRSESIVFEDLKAQANTTRKSAELKFEEALLEERRAKAKIETEMIEAKTKTAKVFAEAEKASAQKEILDSEIIQLKNTKANIEREINEIQINCSRQAYDLEKMTRDFHALVDEKKTIQIQYDNLVAQAKLQAEQNLALQQKLDEREKELQHKFDGLHAAGNRIIGEARKEAAKVIATAKTQADQLAEKTLEATKELEAHKAKTYAELEEERKTLTQKMYAEIESLKFSNMTELKELEQRKANFINEVKWLEDSTNKKCERILLQAQTDAQIIKDQAANNAETVKIVANKDAQAIKDRVTQELIKLKREAEIEISVKNNDAHAYSAKMKASAEEMVEQEKIKLKKEHAQLKKEQDAVEDLKKNLEEAIERTEALKNDNFVQANLKIQAMIAKATQDAAEIEKEAAKTKQKELNFIAEVKKGEIEKIEELKAQFEAYKEERNSEHAALISQTIQEHLMLEMAKSRNLNLDDKLIKKLAEKVKKIATDATLGKIEPGLSGAPGKSGKTKKGFPSFF